MFKSGKSVLGLVMMRLIVVIGLLLITSCVIKASNPLRWYSTCGDPICRDDGYREKPGVPLCMATQKAGESCGDPTLKCDPKDPCNTILVCSDVDPTQGVGGCPISQRNMKKDVRYLTDSDYSRYLEFVLGLNLAHFRYNWEPDFDKSHLGFMIDDVAMRDSPAISRGEQNVDLYGYVSIAVAAIKAQNKEIEKLKEEIALLKKRDLTRH